jgi:hypothetical protein
VARSRLAQRRGEHRLGFVERDDAIHVTHVGAFEEQPTEVFGLGGAFTVAELRHGHRLRDGSTYRASVTFALHSHCPLTGRQLSPNEWCTSSRSRTVWLRRRLGVLDM